VSVTGMEPVTLGDGAVRVELPQALRITIQ
jgi:hypothetical protein